MLIIASVPAREHASDQLCTWKKMQQRFAAKQRAKNMA
jgi:hypothetical protein